jgi:DNA-binding transcriptional LysR family regulator
MPADPFPSLSALRAFAAAGQASSFSKAAVSLHVSQAAVSHQIRVLEGQLGVRLFQRTTRRLSLTSAGRQLLPAAVTAFDLIEKAVAGVRAARSVLALTTTPAFGAKWLAPRLRRFAELHPDIELSVRHTDRSLDLESEGLDLAIRGGGGQWPGLEAEMIGPAITLAVGAPDYLGRLGLREPGDIARATLLHGEGRQDWRAWLKAAGLDPALADKGPVFDDENVLIEAILNGQGAGLIVWSLIAAEIAQGRLVALFDEAVVPGYGYYLVYPPGALALPKIAAFRRFVLAEARASPFPRR